MTYFCYRYSIKDLHVYMNGWERVLENKNKKKSGLRNSALPAYIHYNNGKNFNSRDSWRADIGNGNRPIDTYKTEGC